MQTTKTNHDVVGQVQRSVFNFPAVIIVDWLHVVDEDALRCWKGRETTPWIEVI